LKTFRSDSMKKNVLSLAVATATLSAATAHSAMYLNNEGTGEVLMFPFYDGENGNATNMHIVNTTGSPKAVKVRFLEYKSSYEVLDFNLYLSEYDHFAFGVIQDPNGEGGAIITSDNSCTVPALGSANNGFDGTTTENADGSVTRIQPFVNFEFTKYANGRGMVDSDIARTIRGHVEVIEMGVVTNNQYDPNDTTKAGRAYASFLTHGADGVPANCAGLEAAWATGQWSKDPQLGMTAPTGGLYGLAYHINVEDAAAWGFEPAAIDDWWFDVDGDTAHATPGTINPNLAQTGEKQSIVLVDGESYKRTWLNSLDAVSATLMTKSVSNDVQINSTIGGMTDWVTTFPTKRDYVTAAIVRPPFTDAYDPRALNSAGTAYEELRACEVITVETWDREEAQTTPGNGFSPAPPGAAALAICDEQNTIAWGAGNPSALNVERDLFNLGYSYTEGWARFTFPNDGSGFPINALCDASGSTDACLEGLPLQGFGAYKYANGSTGSVLMNYGHAADHKTEVVWSGDVTSG
jgi:hypothetical protein